ncbi:MAG TPA: GNAT family N-acetyltransferase [Leptospiraceae bacterium]|nr:GNAT family N-acetyltransferase [Leptospiraceae bacterium]HMW04062.1 GNAT family N-acetyltransferase [Leptospiraceae bacterium]HMX30952.1 GNAT family N-acetyltransferase [Leptospiraceae bacterium]HMY30056.1 GNAT family N-acetyltransferase [Leptospiraceae bacterium]HMZ62757.1 GNAT family N-acetyltransferase [Leptospiraceae bacterium]
MKYLFESERHGFRKWRESDVSRFTNMNSDLEVMRYFPQLLSREESINLINRIQSHFEKWNFGLWAVEEKDSENFIGFIGLYYADFQSSFTPCVEIGWRLDSRFWGRGYATEGAKLCLQKGFEEFNLNEIYSFTSILNTKSENVMIKIGMQKVMDFEHPNLEKDHPLCKHVLYRILYD